MKQIKLHMVCCMSMLLITFLMTSCNRNKQTDVSAIHSKVIVIDTHTDTPMRLVNRYFNLAEKHEAPESRVDFPRLHEGSVNAVFFALYTGQRERTPANYQEAYDMANRMLDSTNAQVERNTDMVELAYSTDDIIRLSDHNKTAICIGMENGFPLAKDISRISEFYNKGVRYITLCHSQNNDICDSSTDRAGAEHNGLSDYGREVVTEMNRLGMIVDVSHISDKSFFDVIEISKAPVIASHSSVRSVCDHPRNMNDEMIKALAAKGGVIQICILSSYIAEEDTTSDNYLKLEELRIKYNNWQYNSEAERREAWAAYDSINRHYPPVLPGVSEAVDHIDYVVNLVGVDHVGIGSDFEGGGGLADCNDVSEFPAFTAELLKRGYTEEEIAKIWGGNFLRVFKAVEDIAEN